MSTVDFSRGTGCQDGTSVIYPIDILLFHTPLRIDLNPFRQDQIPRNTFPPVFVRFAV